MHFLTYVHVIERVSLVPLCASYGFPLSAVENRLQNNTSVFFVVVVSDAETQYATMNGVVLCGNGITRNIKNINGPSDTFQEMCAMCVALEVTTSRVLLYKNILLCDV